MGYILNRAHDDDDDDDDDDDADDNYDDEDLCSNDAITVLTKWSNFLIYFDYLLF